TDPRTDQILVLDDLTAPPAWVLDIVRGFPDGVLALDENRESVIAVNRAFLRLIGVEENGATDRVGVHQHIHPDDRAVFLGLGEPGATTRAVGREIRLRDGENWAPTEVFATFVPARQGGPSWIYFFRPRHKMAEHLREAVTIQKRLTADAVRTSMQMYHLASRIRSAPKLASTLVDATDEDTLFRRACDFLCSSAFNCREVTVVLVDESDELRLGYSTRDGMAAEFEDRRAHYRNYLIRGETPSEENVLLLPLYGKEQVVGVLELHYDTRELVLLGDRDEVREWHRDLIETVAEILSLFLENIRLYRKLTNLTIRDAVTGVYNRRYLLSQLVAELKRAVRFGRDLSVVFMDLDGFKEVNDTLGHRQGDRILKELGNLLTSTVRESDFVCRYGGDEFVIILPETDLESAQKKAEHLRDRVAAYDFSLSQDGEDFPLTLSAGVASTRNSIDARGLLNQADRALYMAKRSGKNQVVVLEP
ncbi:MAG: sensor domain-containing diguanylate cyclase, partial [Planctomycetes bacterium]|nr:sensor domain-containing diguanylate cyclase [Planctomycetota bacterium]